MLVSLFCLPTERLWNLVDTSCFTALNASIIGHPLQQAFWAVANIKMTDIFGASFLLGCFLIYIFEAQGQERRRRTAYLLYTLIWFEISILLCKQVVTPIAQWFGLARHGPTSVIKGSLLLSQIAPWVKIKDSSLCCFPADHACIVFQWCALLWFFAGWQRGLFASLFSVLFLLPRLVSGAHWISDLIVGSGSIVAIALAWALFTPLYPWLMDRLYRLVGFQQPVFAQGEL